MVALPGLLPLGVRNVGDVSAVGRERSVFGDGERHSRGESALDRNGVELILEVHEAVGPGIEEDVFAVGRPTGNVFVGRIVGEAARHAAGGGDHKDIAIAVVFAGEGDRGAVGREIGERLDADAGSEAMGVAAIPADGPEIVGVGEDNLRLADGGKAQQKRRGGLGCGDLREGRE